LNQDSVSNWITQLVYADHYSIWVSIVAGTYTNVM